LAARRSQHSARSAPFAECSTQCVDLRTHFRVSRVEVGKVLLPRLVEQACGRIRRAAFDRVFELAVLSVQMMVLSAQLLVLDAQPGVLGRDAYGCVVLSVKLIVEPPDLRGMPLEARAIPVVTLSAQVVALSAQLFVRHGKLVVLQR